MQENTLLYRIALSLTGGVITAVLGALVGLAFAAVNLPSVSTWAGFGSALREWLSVPARLKWFNIAMGVLLAATLWPMLR